MALQSLTSFSKSILGGSEEENNHKTKLVINIYWEMTTQIWTYSLIFIILILRLESSEGEIFRNISFLFYLNLFSFTGFVKQRAFILVKC